MNLLDRAIKAVRAVPREDCHVTNGGARESGGGHSGRDERLQGLNAGEQGLGKA